MNTNFFKRKNNINVYSILVYQCEKALEAANLLHKLMETQNKDLGDKIEQIENEADEKRKEMINYVENTYITPLDRHDLYALSRTLDDITDSITDLKDYLLFFDYQPQKRSMDSIQLIIDSISKLTDAMKSWNDMNTADFIAMLKIPEQNESKNKRLFWKTLRDFNDDMYKKEIVIAKEFCHNLNDIAAIVSKAADRMSDLKIKSIK